MCPWWNWIPLEPPTLPVRVRAPADTPKNERTYIGTGVCFFCFPTKQGEKPEGSENRLSIFLSQSEAPADTPKNERTYIGTGVCFFAFRRNRARSRRVRKIARRFSFAKRSPGGHTKKTNARTSVRAFVFCLPTKQGEKPEGSENRLWPRDYLPHTVTLCSFSSICALAPISPFSTLTKAFSRASFFIGLLMQKSALIFSCFLRTHI